MAVYTIQLADGRKARIDAPDQASAVKAAQAIPALKGEQADYQRELMKRRQANTSRRAMDEGGLTRGVSPAITGAAPIPIVDEGVGILRGLGNEVANVGRRVGGQPTVSSRAIYEANRDAENEYEAQTKQLHPIAGNLGTLLTGLAVRPVAGAAGVPSGMDALWRAVGTGGMVGAASGAAEGRSVGERAMNAVVGGAIGAGTGGVLEGVVAPAATAAVKTGAKVAKDVVRAVAKPSAEKEAASGTKTALALMNRKGLTADAVAAAAPQMKARGELPAEVLGPGNELERQLAATARRGGKTGEALTQKIQERSEAAPDRMLQDMEESLKIDPARATADVASQVELGKQIAGPLYQEIDANPAGIMSPELERLMALPEVQTAIEKVQRSGRIAGREGSGMAMGSVDVPSQPVGPEDLGFPAQEMPVPRGPAQPPSRGPDLRQFLRQGGLGLDDVGGDLAGQGVRINLRQGGRSLDDAALASWEAGYFPELQQRPTINQFLDAVTDQRPRYARQADPAAQQRFEARAAAEDFNQQGGDASTLPHPEDYGNVQAPERPLTEPARVEAPTGESWIRVKRTIDKLVKRDPVTKQVIRTGPEGLFNDDLATLSSRLNNELKNAIPNYREASAGYAEPLAIEDAFTRGQKFGTRGAEGEFRKAWQSLKTEAEREAFKSGVASNLYELWSQGLLKAGRIKNPRMQGKLELAFGRQGARDFIAKLDQEARLAASGNRLKPTGGSPTMGLGMAAQEADRGLSPTQILGMGARALRNPLGAVGDAFGAAAAYGRTAGMSEEARDAFGRILMMGPDELIPLLRDFEKQPPGIQEALRAVLSARNDTGFTGGLAAGTALGGDRPDR